MNPLLDGGLLIGGLANEIVDENSVLLALRLGRVKIKKERAYALPCLLTLASAWRSMAEFHQGSHLMTFCAESCKFKPTPPA